MIREPRQRALAFMTCEITGDDVQLPLRVGLLEPPVNVLRLSLHPQRLAPRILNLTEWRVHLLERLSRQLQLTAAPVLAELKDELKRYPAPPPAQVAELPDYAGVAVPLRLIAQGTVLSFISATTVFGTPTDVTVSELALETFFPADPETAEALRGAYSGLQKG